VSENKISVVNAALDPDGSVLPSKVSLSIDARIPLNIDSGDTSVADALAILRDIVASDEFAASLTTQNFLK